MPILWKRYITRPMGAAIRGYDTRVGSVGAVLVHNLEVMVLSIGTLGVSHIVSGSIY